MNNGDLPIGYIPFVEGEFTAFMDGIKGGRNYGLTKREYFAAMAMQGMNLRDAGNFSKHDREMGIDQDNANWAAEMAVKYADALLAALDDSE